MALAKPIILVVGEDPETRERLSRVLEQRFGHDYTVLTRSSPVDAVDELAKMRARADRVALVLADRSTEMSGPEFLARSRSVYQAAKRVCLSWYGNPEYSAQLEGMIKGDIDYYLPSHWSSPEHVIYPVVQEMLSEWATAHLPQFEAVRVVGERWSPRSVEFRDLLKRNNIPHGFYASDSAEGQKLLDEAGVGREQLPVVILWNGGVFVDPSNTQVGAALGVQTEARAEDVLDVSIIGAGPAGLAAAVYAASEGLHTVVVEPDAVGGQAGTTSMIRNYLGFPRGLSGAQLAARGYEQAELFGAKFIFTRKAVAIEAARDERIVRLSGGGIVKSRAVIIATGVTYRRLQVPALERLLGRGVFYGAAVTEAPAMRGKDVFVAGGGNSAGQAATYLSRFAHHIAVLVRGNSLAASMSDYLIKEMEQASNIDIRYGTEVVGAAGDTGLSSLVLRDAGSGATTTVSASALFVLIGAEPHADWLKGTVQQDPAGYVATGRDLLPSTWPLERAPLALETSVPGVFAVGDVRSHSIQRVAAAAGEGSTAVRLVHQYLSLLPGGWS